MYNALISLLCLYSMLLFASCDSEDTYIKTTRQAAAGDAFEGKIAYKQEAWEVSRMRYIVLNDSAKWHIHFKKPFDYVKEGDYIIKRKNTVFYKVIRGTDTSDFYPETDKWIIKMDTLIRKWY